MDPSPIESNVLAMPFTMLGKYWVTIPEVWSKCYKSNCRELPRHLLCLRPSDKVDLAKLPPYEYPDPVAQKIATRIRALRGTVIELAICQTHLDEMDLVFRNDSQPFA